MFETTTRRLVLVALLGVLACGSAIATQDDVASPQEMLDSMGIVGYADALSVQPGETIRFMVSSQLPRYRAEIVRLIHGDADAAGPGIKEMLIDTPANGEYAGERQVLPLGSWVTVPDDPALRLRDSFTITAWIAPTRPGRGDWHGEPGVQGIITKWSEDSASGYGLFIDELGRLALWVGDADGRVEKLTAEPALRAWQPAIPGAGWPRAHGVPTQWIFVAASFDASTKRARLVQQPLDSYPNDPTKVIVEGSMSLPGPAATNLPLLMAAYGSSDGQVAGHYSGKIENPRLYDRALSQEEIAAIQRGAGPTDALAAWDFAADIESDRVSDTSARHHHGVTVNQPTRAVTGHTWNTLEMDYKRARDQYGAIHFHDDDLLDARWKVGFEFPVPEGFKSGVYAARLRTTTSEDYVPFFVRPPAGTATAKIALLIPTVSYLAYSYIGDGINDNLSLYSAHTDGSGITYSSRLRPDLLMRPKHDTDNPWQFMADTHLVDWLEVKGFTVDVLTDEDLHFEGVDLLAAYNVVLTGTHPEYYTTEMLHATRQYLEQGGRLMYMGGNGFYWVTALDPSGRFIEVRRRDGTEAWQGAPGESYHSLTGEPGGLWRFRGLAPQWLVGVGFSAQGFDRNSPFRRMPGSFDPRVSFIFEGIGANELIGNHPSLVLDFGAAGSELDRVDTSLGSPPDTLILATSFGHSDAYQHVVEEVNTSNSRQGGTVNPLVKADMAYVDYPNGGAVFSTSSIAWCGSLSFNDYDNNVSRITENVLRRFASDEPLPAPPAP